MLFALTACGNIGGQNDEDVVITLGDTGATVVIPANMGFEAQESEQNDFYGRSSLMLSQRATILIPPLLIILLQVLKQMKLQ